jgi:hypothetical protein
LQALGKGMGGLKTTYNQAMQRIEGQGHDREILAKQILSWIVHSKRPLSTLELQHALAVQENMTALDTDFLPTTKVMLSLCAGLVTIDEESGIIRLVHYTTQEYFQQTQKQWFPKAESDIATTCVTYLSFDTFKSGFCLSAAETSKRLQSNPLYIYTSQNWEYHAREASMQNESAVESRKVGAKVEALVMSFLESLAKVEASTQAMGFNNENLFHARFVVPRKMTRLHLAAHFGLAKALKALLENAHDPDPTDSTGRTPLSWAAANGCEATVKVLLEKGAERDLEDEDHRTPLS